MRISTSVGCVVRRPARTVAAVVCAGALAGLIPALAGSASAATGSAALSPAETASCQSYQRAQAAGPGQVTSDLRTAAGDATAAAKADPAWRPVASALNYEVGLPDAMLTATQLSTVKADNATIQSACAGSGGITFGPLKSAATPGALSANTATAWNYFIGNTSLTAVQVAGLEGNLMVESGVNPAAAQGGCTYPPGPCGYGIAQWTRPGGRYTNLQNLAASEGVSMSTLPVQLQFVWQELTTTASYGLAALQACTTTACATQTVMTKYERPANQSTNCSASPQPSYCTRLADANELLAAYSYGTPTTATQIVRNPAGSGYWLLSAAGGVYSYGGAHFSGSAAGQSYFSGQTAVGMAATPDGNGYWIVSSSGAVYAYGDAKYEGGANNQSYFAGQTAVGMAATPDGNGYWIVSSSGAVYAYGDAKYEGGANNQSYFAGQTAVGMAADPSGNGYWIVSAAGGVYSYGNAPSEGAAAGQSYFAGRKAVSLADSADGGGYLILSADGSVYAYGNAVYSGGGI
jgi:Phage tail lysozyme